MGGNPQEILAALSDKRRLEPSGEPSLQNGLTMAKGGMAYVPFFRSTGFNIDEKPSTLDFISRNVDPVLCDIDRRPRWTGVNPRHSEYASPRSSSDDHHLLGWGNQNLSSNL